MIETEKQKKAANIFFKEALEILQQSKADFMLGGAFAMFEYTGVFRNTKDLDIFCKPSSYPQILKTFAENGYKTELTDVRWLAKVFHNEYFIDIIFDSVNNICVVNDDWFKYATPAEVCGIKVKVIPAEELVWCKIYVQNRERFDGADLNHIWLKHGKKLDWHRLLSKVDQHWHLLLAHLLVFQFVYPADYREIIPEWLFNELIKRAHEQYDLPAPVEQVCRGPLIDQTQYGIDIKEWNYKALTMKTV